MNTNIKELFADDPAMIAALTQTENQKLMRSILDKLEQSQVSAETHAPEILNQLLSMRRDALRSELRAVVEPMVENGKDGATPVKGVDYFDGEDGAPGEPGKDGKTPTDKQLTALIKPLIPKVERGEDGKSVSVQDLIEAIKSLEGRDAADFGKAVGAKIDISQVRNASSFMKDGIKYKIEELMHGGAAATTPGSFTILTATGTIDDSNVTFTFTSEPSLVNVNGAFYKQTGGAITWTYGGGTVTLSSPVGTGGSIYGIA